MLELSDCFGKDGADITKWATAAIKQQEGDKPFGDKLEALFKETKAGAALAREAKGKGKGKGKGKCKGKGRHFGDELPERGLEEEEARALCPPVSSCRIYRDEGNRRWLGYIYRGSKSRAWHTYGDLKASAIVILWLWNEFKRCGGGQPCPVGWIAELGREEL